MTRRIVFALMVVGILSGAMLVRAQVTQIGPTDAIGFDYLTADLTSFSVSGFSVQWDAGVWTSIGIPAAAALPDTIVGGATYKVIPSFTTGNHTFSVRACNLAGCSAGTSPFAFTSVSGSPTGMPSNVRKVIR